MFPRVVSVPVTSRRAEIARSATVKRSGPLAAGLLESAWVESCRAPCARFTDYWVTRSPVTPPVRTMCSRTRGSAVELPTVR